MGKFTSIFNPKENDHQEKSNQIKTPLEKSQDYLEIIKQRRSIRNIENKEILSKSELIKLIETGIRETPSAFNIQSSRILILLGEENKNYWLNIVIPKAEKFFGGSPEKDELFKQRFLPKFQGYSKGVGSVLFFESQNTLEESKIKNAFAAPYFDQWSTHGTGMAQINTWNLLSFAGYGCSLQHFGAMVQSEIIEKYQIPSDWKIHAELVFGSPNETPAEKEYIDDSSRFKIVG